MRRAVAAGAVATAIVLAGCGGDGGDGDGGDGSRPAQAPPSMRVELQLAEGGSAGTVELTERAGGVEVRAQVQGLEPGFHGFHVHEAGVCDADAVKEGEPAPYSSAKGHFTGGESDHGEHAGDLPTLLVGDDGTGMLTVRTDRFTIDDLRDADGSALMVHAMRDNQANVPDRYESEGEAGPDADTLDTGDAGARVACGKVTR